MRVALARKDPFRSEKLEPLAILSVSEMAMVGLWVAGTTFVRVMRPLELKPILPWGCYPGSMDAKLSWEDVCITTPARREALLAIECCDGLASDLMAASDTARPTDRNVGHETQRSRRILAELEFALNAAGERAYDAGLKNGSL